MKLGMGRLRRSRAVMIIDADGSSLERADRSHRGVHPGPARRCRDAQYSRARQPSGGAAGGRVIRLDITARDDAAAVARPGDLDPVRLCLR
jgi:hypothetical protein